MTPPVPSPVLPATGPSPLLGGRYRLQEVVGRGASADVHRARDIRLDRQVAGKLGRAGSALPNGAAELSAEARRMAMLTHPGLVAVHDLGTADGRPYVVMDLVGGSTLLALLAERPDRRLALEDVRALGAELADALTAVHAAGLVHRDVKPANILVEADDDGLRPRLTDFGISRLLDATRQTETGTTLGTAPYLAPEQVLGRPVTAAADVYALGLVLLECLTGRLEYPGPAVEAAVARLHRPPRLPADLPERDRGLLTAMLADDPAARPVAHEVARRWRGEQPAVTATATATTTATTTTTARSGRPALPPRPRRSPRRRPRARILVSTAVAAVALSAGAAAAGAALLPETEVPPLPAPPVSGPTGDALQDLHDAVSS